MGNAGNNRREGHAASSRSDGRVADPAAGGEQHHGAASINRTPTAPPDAQSATDGSDRFWQVAPRPLARTVAIIEAAIDFLGRAAAWIGVALILLIAANVGMRYLLDMGYVGLQELEWHLMPPLVMIGISYALLHGEHVRVDLIHGLLPERGQHLIDLLAALTMIVIAIVVVQLSVNYVGQSYRIGEGSPDPGGLPHRWIIKAMIPLGFVLLGLQAVASGIRSLVLMVKGMPNGR